MLKKKTHFIAINDSDWWIEFQSKDWSMKMYWAWWNKTQVNYILQALIELYWKQEGIEIYQKFNYALTTVSDITNSQSDMWRLWVLTLYPQKRKWSTDWKTELKQQDNSN